LGHPSLQKELKLGDTLCLRRPAPSCVRPGCVLRFTPLLRQGYHNDSTPCRETLCFVYTCDGAADSDKTYGPKASRGASHFATLPLRFLCSFIEQSHPIWQDGYHDHALRAEESLEDVARYIVMNPVRAGLVKSVREYPLWDAKWL